MAQRNNSSSLNDESSRQRAEEIAQLKASYSSSDFAEDKKFIKKLEEYKDDIVKANLVANYELRKKYENEIAEQNKKANEATLKEMQKAGNVLGIAANQFKEAFDSDNLGKTLDAYSNKLSSVLESRMSTYISDQQALISHLTGSSDSLDNVTSKISILSSTGLVKQTAVYNNLTNLVKSGITANAEQKAFLQTMSENIAASFDASSSSLVQLINLQRQDLSANRFALETSLQEFLNQNYETSTYIKESFYSVSESLLQMQSLMSSSAAMASEATVQQWLGAFSSSGGSQSTIQSLANAINSLGSGDISNLNSGINKLLLMGTVESGQDFSSLINNGVTSQSLNSVLQGTMSYLASMGSYSSNVVKSQLASIFGVNVSDIVAAQNLMNSEPTGGVSTDISGLFSRYDSTATAVTQLQNLMTNFLDSWAMNMVNTPWTYATYTLSSMLSNTLGDALSGTSLSTKLLGNGFDTNIGIAIKSVNLLSTMVPLIKTLAGSISGIGWGTMGSAGLYSALLNDSKISGAGEGFTTKGLTTSAVVNYSTGNTDDLIKQAKNSIATGLGSSYEGEGNSYTTSDIGSMLDSGRVSMLGTSLDRFDTIATSSAEVSQIAGENIADLLSVTKDIYSILEERLSSIDETISSIANNTSGYSDQSSFMVTI